MYQKEFHPVQLLFLLIPFIGIELFAKLMYILIAIFFINTIIKTQNYSLGLLAIVQISIMYLYYNKK
jgi:hypothetical protein